MSVNEINLNVARKDAVNINRGLGIAAIIGAPMLLFQFVYSVQFPDPQAPPANFWVALLGVFYIGGWICGAVVMYRQKIYGDTLAGKVVFTIQMIFLTLAFLFSVQDTYGINYDNGGGIFFGICDAGYPLSHLFMIFVGIFTIRAKKWQGLARFAPLLVGFSLLLTFALGAICGMSVGIILFGALTTIGLGTIGWKIFKK